MRNTLAISAVALMLGALATPSEAQNAGRNGGQRSFGGQSQGGFSGGSVSQRSFQGPSRSFESRSFQGSGPSGNRFGNNGGNDNRRFRSVQPPSPGSQVGNAGNTGNRRTFGIQPPAPGNVGNAGNGATPRSFGVQPPAPGNVGNAGNGATPRSFGVQPPAPGNVGNAGNVAGNGGNRSIQSVGPPPAGTAPGSAQPPIGASIRPPLASPAIPSATTTAAVATVGAVAVTGAVAASSASATPAPATTPAAASVTTTSDTAIIGQPIGPSTAPAPAANSDLPPLEMLASVGEPIMPLSQAPTAATIAAQATTQAATLPVHGASRVVRRVVVEEACNVPSHSGPRYSGHHYGAPHHGGYHYGGSYGYRRW